MTSGAEEFTLSAALGGHDNEVRAVAAVGDTVFTGAQDRMLYAWTLVDGMWVQTGASADHEHWITSMLAVEPGRHPRLPHGGVVTGSMDKRIRVFDMQCTCLQTLSGHDGGVISLAMDADGHLVSGSWDGTARVWDLAAGTAIATLPGHENGVAVHALGDGTIVTGSTGMQQGNDIVGYQIRLWRDGQVKHYARDHQAAVRAFAPAPVGFASASNDGSVRLRGPDGAAVQVMSSPQTAEGRPPFLLSLAALPSGELASGGDDCSVRIWRGGECAQEVQLPSTVWSLCATARGDIVAACGDKKAYVFTRDSARAADAATADALQRALKAHAAGPSEVDVAALPAWEDRMRQAAKQGAVQVFNKNGKAWAARWDEADGAWLEIGEVTGSKGGSVGDLAGGATAPGMQLSRGKQELNGQYYDCVVPVEAETPEGPRSLRLGFDFADDPYVVAQTFAAQHALPDMYVEQIADYVRQNTPAHLTAAHLGDALAATAAAPAAVGGRAALRTLPPAAYLRFDGCNFAGLRKKVLEFNDALAKEGGPSLDAEAVGRFGGLMDVLEDTSRYHASAVPAQARTVFRGLLAWPVDRVFPAVDLLRVALLHPRLADAVPAAPLRDALSSALGKGGFPRLAHTPRGRPAAETAAGRPLVMLALRAAANAFVHDGARGVAFELRQEIADLVRSSMRIAHKSVLHAAGVALQNLALAVHRKAGGPSGEPWVGTAARAIVELSIRILQSPVEGREPACEAAKKALGVALLCEPTLKGEVARAGVDEALGADETGREVLSLLQ